MIENKDFTYFSAKGLHFQNLSFQMWLLYDQFIFHFWEEDPFLSFKMLNNHFHSQKTLWIEIISFFQIIFFILIIVHPNFFSSLMYLAACVQCLHMECAASDSKYVDKMCWFLSWNGDWNYFSSTAKVTKEESSTPFTQTNNFLYSIFFIK